MTVTDTGANITGTLSVSGNTTVGNLITNGSSGNISGANVISANTFSATGNITAGNITTTGPEGNITGANVISANTFTASGNIISVGGVAGGSLTSYGILDVAGTGSFGANVDMNGYWLNNVGYAVNNTDAASKQYVDTLVSTGISYHQPVNVATTTTLAVATGGTTAYNSPNGAANGIGAYISTTGVFNLIDTSNVQTVGTRILVKDEANAAWNGIYTYSNTTAITRATDADEYGTDNTQQLGINNYFFTLDGSVNKGLSFIVSAPAGTITFGTSNITFAVFSTSQVYTGGTGITVSGTVINSNASQTQVTAVGTLTTLSVSGNSNIGNIGTGGLITSTGNITGGNLTTSGLITSTGNITGGNLTTGGLITSTGNVRGGNLTTAGLITSTGNITGGNLTTAGLITSTGNVRGGNLTTSGALSVTGNANVGNIGAAAGVFTTVTGSLTTAAQPNITSVGTLTSVSVSGNSNVGNLNTGGLITSTGNITGGNLVTAGNVIGANVTVNLQLSGNTANFTGNVTALNFLGNVSGNISGNISIPGSDTGVVFNDTGNANSSTAFTFNKSSNVVSATGNLTAGNLTTGGVVTATGNVQTSAQLVSSVATGTSPLIVTSTTQVANLNVATAGVAGTVTTNSQPNITSTGVLSSLSVSGNANVGNIGATDGVFTTVTGTLTTASQPNITSVGILSGLSVSGGIEVNGNVQANTNIVVTGNISSGNANLGNLATANYFSGTLTTATQPNITSTGVLTSLSVSGNITTGNLLVASRGAIGVAPQQEFHVSRNGSDTDGNGSITNPYRTIGYALTLVGSGAVIIVHPGEYAENVTVNNLSGVAITAAQPGAATPQTYVITGNVVVSGTSGSVLLHSVGVVGNITHSSSGSFFVTAIQMGAGNNSTTFNKTGTGYLEVFNGNWSGGTPAVNVTGDGLVTFNGVQLTNLTVNNANASVILRNIPSANNTILTSGTLTVISSTMVGNSNTAAAITTVAGTLNIQNSILLRANNTAGTMIVGASTAYLYDDIFFDRANSTLSGIPISGTIFAPPAEFQAIRADSLSVVGNIVVGNISGANVISANLFTGTLTTSAQPNITSTGVLTSLSVSGTSNLGPVGNVTITGGSSGQYLQTNGSGVLTWASVSSGTGISNGRSNVDIPTANGNVNISSAGNANILVVTGTGANITGTLSVSGNSNVGNIGATDGVFTTVAGSLTTNSQPNITSIGTLTSLSVSGNSNIGNIGATGGVFTTVAGSLTTNSQPNITSTGTLSSLSVSGTSNLGAVGNVTITGGTNGYYLQTNGAGVLSWASVPTASGISNGNSNVNIATANGNVTITSGGTKTWTFDSDGNTSMPGNLNITGNIIPSANITYDLGTSANRFKDLYLANSTIYIGNQTISANTTNVIFSGIISGNADGLTNIPAANITGNAGSNFTANYSNYAGNLINGNSNVNITTANSNVTITSNGIHTWNFNDTGNLVLPANTFAINYANGTQVPLGSNTGNVTFSNQIVIGTGLDDGTGGLYLATGPNGSANLQYLQVRGGDVATHIHLDTGNNSFYDQYFGNDSKYVKLSAGDTGNVVIGTDNGNGTLYSWNFNSSGNLVLPTISLGGGADEQTYIRSQRKVIPPFRWSAVIDGATPTVVYTAANPQTTSMKVTVQVQHQGFSMEFFDVSATKAGADTYYTVSNRVAPPTIAASTVVVDLNGSTMQITVTVNSGATSSYVTYDSTEFGIPND
jgi:hypothetical protein